MFRSEKTSFEPLNYIPAPGCDRNQSPNSHTEVEPQEVPLPMSEPGSQDTAAQSAYAYQCQHGIGCEKDLHKAVHWYTLAAEAGHKEALLALVDIYLDGYEEGIPLSTKARHYEKAAELNHPRAVNELGRLYHTGALTLSFSQMFKFSLEELKAPVSSSGQTGIEPGEFARHAVAFQYFKKAAELGDPEAHSNIGRCYMTGRGTGKDFAQALAWLKMGSALGSLKGKYWAGRLQLYARGQLRDRQKGLELLEEAAEEGCEDAQKLLIKTYSGSKDKSEQKAYLKWCLKEAARGNSQAMYQVGSCYRHGVGTKKNVDLAFQYLSRAAEKGYREAKVELAALYRHGEGTDKNNILAFKLTQEAAEKGSVKAQGDLGWFFQSGIGCAPDLTNAYAWYLRAARNKDRQAQYRLGSLLIEGKVQKRESKRESKKQGFAWLLSAAKQGYKAAQVKVATIYETEGDLRNRKPSPDLVAAYEWYEKAAFQGVESAQMALERLKTSQS